MHVPDVHVFALYHTVSNPEVPNLQLHCRQHLLQGFPGSPYILSALLSLGAMSYHASSFYTLCSTFSDIFDVQNLHVQYMWSSTSARFL